MLEQKMQIGTIALRNRLVLPPMATYQADECGNVTQALCDYYTQRTKSERIGLAIIEHSFVCPQGRAAARQLSAAEDSVLPGLQRLVEAIQNSGTRAFVQISHAGGMTNSAITQLPVVAASAVVNPGHKTKDGIVPAALCTDEIRMIVWQFAEAALRSKKAGFDGVEIHSAHSYLLNEFYSPLTNHRTDEYGGSLKNRLRLHLEIISAVREAVGPDYPIAMRLGACDYSDGGNTCEDGAAAAEILEQAGLDLLDISGGMCRYTRAAHTEAGYFADSTTAIKRAVSIPVILTGGITRREEAERFLCNGSADLIGVGRAQLRDADWAEKEMGQR